MWKKNILAILVLGSSIFLPVGCSRKPVTVKVDLPPTPVLTVKANWGVVVSPYLRVRKTPSTNGEVVAHLRNSSITEILSRTAYPETVEGKADYWYEISSEGIRGWVFGSYLKFFDTKTEAEQAATNTQNG
ncbi:MAG: hypothetical protein Kow009_04480 [Spirochaetales bacterium]